MHYLKIGIACFTGSLLRAKPFLVDKNESPIRSIPNEFRNFEWTCLLYSDVTLSVETHF
jgi:hypothetical protein